MLKQHGVANARALEGGYQRWVIETNWIEKGGARLLLRGSLSSLGLCDDVLHVLQQGL